MWKEIDAFLDKFVDFLFVAVPLVVGLLWLVMWAS
jgi:hypothetical protein